MQPAQWIAALLAVALLVIGIIGFTRTGVSDWSSTNSATVIGLHLTAWRSLIYVVAGAVGILFALVSGTSRLYGWLLVIGFAALVLWGLAVTGTFSSNPVSGAGNPLRLAASDNWWHAGGAVLGLIAAVLPARRTIVTDEPAVAETTTETTTVEPEDDRMHHRHRAEDRTAVLDEQPEHDRIPDQGRPADAGMEPMPAAQSGDAVAEPTRRSHWWSPGGHDRPAHR